MGPGHFRLLYDYNLWANHCLLDAGAALSEEQLTRDLRSSFPSVRDTLAHILGAEWVWCERIHGNSPSALPPGWNFPDLGSLRARWADVERNLLSTVAGGSAADLDREVRYRNFRGNPFAYPLHQILRHVVNHSSYHRGQATTLLRQIGAAPVATDLIVYFREKGGQQQDAGPGREAIRRLFDYNAWANRRAVEAATALNDAQFTQDLGSSFPSVRDTLVHIMGAEWLWLERVRGRSPTTLLPAYQFPDLGRVERRWSELERDLGGFVVGLSAADLGRVNEYKTTKGVPSVNPLWQMLQHLINHSTYHRGQVTTLMRQLGVQPRPTDFLRYLDVLAGQSED